MTTRDEARRLRPADREAVREPERASLAPAQPTLPDRLREARDRRGVDLYRAERDTKIRARYLAALEQGEWEDLPGAVYTKGFLRNYALYLGLDPEDVIRQWRRERGDASIPAEPVLAVPRPLAAPRPGLTFSPMVVVGALLTVLIAVFVAYIGVQLVRFAKPPTLEITSPAQMVVDVEEDTTAYLLAGTSTPGASVTVSVPGRDRPYLVSADAAGRWSVEVELRRGRNQFDVSAVDPETGKQAEIPRRVFITVPFPVVEAPTLTVESPADGAQFQNGAIPVKGATTNAAEVVVTAEWLGTVAGAPAEPATASPPAVEPVSVAVAEDGSFDAPLDLSAGRWRITITATSAGGKKVSLAREVTVAYQGVNLVVSIQGGRAWLKVWVDGRISDVTGQAGVIYGKGKVLTFTGVTSIEVRTGNAAATYFTLNGVDLGRLDAKENPGTWLFQPPDPPVRSDRR